MLPGTMALNKIDLYNATASSDASEDFRTRHIGDFSENSLVLRASGFIFDVINGLSAVDVDLKSRYNISEHTDYELVQPDRDRSPYGSKDESLKALWTSLVWGGTDLESKAFDCPNTLCLIADMPDQTGQLKEFKALSDRWYPKTKSLHVHGQTIEDWFKAAANTSEGRSDTKNPSF